MMIAVIKLIIKPPIDQTYDQINDEIDGETFNLYLGGEELSAHEHCLCCKYWYKNLAQILVKSW